MADKKISQLSNATTPLAGTEVLPIVQGGSTVKVSVANLTAGRTVDATTVNATTVDATNVEVTNVKAKDGTASLAIADSTGVVTASANPILNAGTANGVVYLNASKSATSGTSLVFDGTKLGIGGVPGAKLDIRSGDALFSSTTTTANTAVATMGAYQFGYPEANQFASISFLNGPTSWFSGSAIVFKTNGSADTTANPPTEKFMISGTGDVTVSTGNLVVGTANKGIDFSASSHAAGMTSELLNDYEEGTWTATVKGGTTDPTTPLTGTGYYTKIGRQVTAIFELNAGNATGATGQIQIAGLPYANWAASRSSGTLWHDRASSTSVEAMLNASSSTVVAVDGKGQAVTWATSGTTYMNLCITYFV